MQTSGTIATQPITVDTLVTHALQRCGKLPATTGGELLQRVREALYFLVADMGNDGINLWCMTKSVVNVVPYNAAYQLPVGTNDCTEALYRTLWKMNGVLSSPTPDVLQFTASASLPLDNISARFTEAGTASLAVDYSYDGATWYTLITLQSVEVIPGAVFVVDLDNTANATYWRLREITGTPILGMDDVRFRKINNELLMSRMNRDDYTNLPNKHYQGQKALQFWFDKQIEPRVWVWPVPMYDVGQIVFWAASQVQDPGDLTNSLAVPTRWYRYVQAALSHMTAFLIPQNELAPGRLEILKADADECRLRASNGESDGSSYQLAPLIGGYTA